MVILQNCGIETGYATGVTATQRKVEIFIKKLEPDDPVFSIS